VEIDWIEEEDGVLRAFEFKYNPKKSQHFPKRFLTHYPEATVQTITPENMYAFIYDSPQ